MFEHTASCLFLGLVVLGCAFAPIYIGVCVGVIGASYALARTIGYVAA